MNFELTGDRIVGMKILGYEFEWDMGCVRKSNWKVPSPEMGEAAGRWDLRGKDEFSFRCVKFEVSEILVEILSRQWYKGLELERNVRLKE